MRVTISVCSLLLLCSAWLPRASAEDAKSLFQKPVQLTAANEPMGNGIYYPSPKLQDLDGDGVAEMLIGDLTGRLLFAKRSGDENSTAWSQLEPLTTADGQPIKFDNW
ncbi:MAG: hypothetical protein R3C19_05535 [Planctomycetaceae bacterium]